MNDLKFFTVKQYPGFVFIENEYTMFALKKNEKLVFILSLKDTIYIDDHKKIPMSPHKLTELIWPTSLSAIVEKLENEEELPTIELY